MQTGSEKKGGGETSIEEEIPGSLGKTYLMEITGVDKSSYPNHNKTFF